MPTLRYLCRPLTLCAPMLKMSASTVDTFEVEGAAWDGRAFQLIAAVLLFSSFLLQMRLVTNREVMTNDEGYHTYAGFRYWQCGDFGVNPEHPPLAKLLAAAPLRWTYTANPEGPCPVASTVKGIGYADSNAWLYATETGGWSRVDRVLPLARAAMLVWPALLACVVFFFSRALFGGTAALFALALLTFEPTLVAHGCLVTTDMALSACALLAVSLFYWWQRAPSWWRLAAAGLGVGLALSVKHSGVLILPAIAVLALLPLVQKNGWQQRTMVRRQFGALALVVLIGWAVLWMTYRFRFTARPDGVGLSLPLDAFVAQTIAQGNRSLLLRFIPTFARLHLLPEAYLYGFVDVLSISNPGQTSFLLGYLYPHGVPWYFPAVVLIKTTFGMLLLATTLLIARVHRQELRGAVWLAVPAAVWMLAGMVSTLNIGYRHVLPMIAPLCCVLGAGTAVLWSRRSKRMRWLIVLFLGAHTGASLASFPNELAFGNMLFGGVQNSHAVLTDSNNDWSQALPQLEAWLQNHEGNGCWFAYDGVAQPAHSGIHCKALVPNLFGVDDPPPSSARQTGTFVISGLSQSGIEWERPDLNPYDVFRSSKPVAVIGGADMVYQGTYDLSLEIAVHRTVNAMTLNGQGNYSGALELATAAAHAFPTSALAHLQRANALRGLHRAEEAHREYEEALRIAEPLPQWYFLSLPEMRAGKAATQP